jgi:hypothetical protein
MRCEHVYECRIARGGGVGHALSELGDTARLADAPVYVCVSLALAPYVYLQERVCNGLFFAEFFRLCDVDGARIRRAPTHV